MKKKEEVVMQVLAMKPLHPICLYRLDQSPDSPLKRIIA
jgi:hypothetical protein